VAHVTANRPAESAHAVAGTPQPIGTVRSYDDLRRIVAEHCARLGMTRAELDIEAGIADGHAAKLLARRARKKLGMVTLGRVMAAVGLVLQVAIDPDAQAAPQARPARAPRRHWRQQRGSSWGKRMAARRALKLSADQRSEIARNAAQARWQRQPRLNSSEVLAAPTNSSASPSSPRST
jgi:hypothetical protein